MTELDQYETEPRIFYSGSFTDTAVVGNILTADAATFNRSRGVIASKISGLTAYFFSRKWLYSDWLGYISGCRGSGEVRFSRIVDGSEFFLDSFAPGPIDIYKEYVRGRFRLLSIDMSGSGEFNIKPIKSGSVGAFPNNIGGPLALHMDVGDGTNEPNTTGWNVSFPFQSSGSLRLKKRILSPSPTLVRPVSASTDIFQTLLDVPGTSSVEIGAIVYGGNDSHRLHFVVELPVHPTASIIRGNSDTKKNESVRITTELLQKVFFGFGDGLIADLDGAPGNPQLTGPYVHLGHTLPDYRDRGLAGLYHHTDTYSGDGPVTLHGPILRGYKYGLIDALPLGYSAVFRSNQWGQVRDMLEQRLYTATLDRRGIGVSIDYPINIKFVSGTTTHARSLDYLTASNPDYNPTDSGMYDRYYRSGQPFSDG